MRPCSSIPRKLCLALPTPTLPCLTWQASCTRYTRTTSPSALCALCVRMLLSFRVPHSEFSVPRSAFRAQTHSAFQTWQASCTRYTITELVRSVLRIPRSTFRIPSSDSFRIPNVASKLHTLHKHDIPFRALRSLRENAFIIPSSAFRIPSSDSFRVPRSLILSQDKLIPEHVHPLVKPAHQALHVCKAFIV